LGDSGLLFWSISPSIGWLTILIAESQWF
jgi:hypothetical protein